MKLIEAINIFLTSMVGLRSINTIIWYKNRLPDLAKYLGDKYISQITIQDLRQWRADLFNRSVRYVNHPYQSPKLGGLSIFTIHQFIRGAKKFFNWLEQEGLINNNPARTLELPSLPKQKPRGIEPELFRSIANALVNRPRDLAIVYFLADTGCRVGGLCGLRIKHIDLPNRTAIVTEKGEISRSVFYLDNTADYLKSWLQIRPVSNHDYLWVAYRNPHNPLLPSGVYEMLKKVSCNLGYETGFNPHNFRHAAIRGWLNAGMPLPNASRLAGHASTAITGDIYGVVSEAKLKADHEQYSWIKAVG